MSDVLAEINAAIASGKADAATIDRLIAAAEAELRQTAGNEANEARAQRLDAAEKTFEEETSPLALAKHVGSEAWERLKGMGRGAKKLGEVAAGGARMVVLPIADGGEANPARQMMRNPAARRELGRGLSDTLLGFPARISDAIRTGTGGEATYAPNEEADAADPSAKDYRAAGQIAGSVTPGSATNVLGRGAFALATRLGVSPAIAALAASSLASGGTAAAHVDAGDAGDRLKAGLQVGGDPLNLLVPATVKGVQAAGKAGRGLAAKMRDDTSALGGGADTLKALDTMRSEGRLTGNLARKVKDPELEALPIGKKGYAKASQQARDKIGANTTKELADARAQYAKEFEAIAAEHGDTAYSMEGPQARLNKLRESNMVNGEAIDDALGAALDKAERMITTKKSTIIGADEMGAREATVADMLKVKRAMDTKAEWGTPATPENRPYRTIARAFAEQAEGLDPRIRALNQKYKTTMDKLEETNDILYGKEAPDVADRPAAKRRAAGALMRADDDTTAGTLAEEGLDRLAELDPRNAAAIQKVKEKKAIERTRFGMPKMSKSPEKWGVGALEQNLEAVRARVVDPLARLWGSLGIDKATQAILRARLAAAQSQENQVGREP